MGAREKQRLRNNGHGQEHAGALCGSLIAARAGRGKMKQAAAWQGCQHQKHPSPAALPQHELQSILVAQEEPAGFDLAHPASVHARTRYRSPAQLTAPEGQDSRNFLAATSNLRACNAGLRDGKDSRQHSGISASCSILSGFTSDSGALLRFERAMERFSRDCGHRQRHP